VLTHSNATSLGPTLLSCGLCRSGGVPIDIEPCRDPTQGRIACSRHHGGHRPL